MTIIDYKITKFQVLDLIKGDLVTFPGFTFKMNLDIGLGLPVCEITTNSNSLFRSINSVEIGKVFKIVIDDEEYEFVILQYSSIQKTGGLKFICMLNNLEYINKCKQSYVEGSSIDALKSITSTPVIADDITTNDNQIWIQDNIPDRIYAKNILLHSNCENDHLLYYVDLEGKLIVKNYNDLITEETDKIFGGEDATIELTPVTVESIPASFKFNVEGNQVVSSQEADKDSYKEDNTGEMINSSTVIIDNGNTHDNYFISYNWNNTRYCKMMKRLYTTHVKRSDFLYPLDVITFGSTTDNSDLEKMPDLIGKNFIISGVETTISEMVLSQRIRFCAIEEEE